MNKTQFIQTTMATFLAYPEVREKPIEQRFDFAIGLAEAAWKKLTERGYGAKVEGEPKENRNWYAELEDQEAFDRCWHKYGKEGARNEAAKAWLKLEESDKTNIYQAVVKYLEQLQHSGVTKAHFSTWLNGRRFESFEAVEVQQQPKAINEKAQEIQYLQGMIARASDANTKAALQAQLDRLMT